MRFSGSCVDASSDFLTDRRLALGAVAVAATAALAVALPLLTYSVSLALFGLAHVAAEMRYVGRRFGARIQGGMAAGLVLLLAAIVLLRLAQQIGWWQGTERLQTELAVVVGLAGLALPALLRHAGLPLGVGVSITSVLALGLLVSPIGTALLLACLHNLTPVGFLAEALRGRERRVALRLAAVVFCVVPLLILSGIPAVCLDAVDLHAPEVTVLPTGPLADQLGAYLPRSLHEATWASDAFSALVFAQCMHYASVLHVLPAIGERSAAPLEASARQWVWRGLTLFIAAALLAGFIFDFKMARGWYGIFAAVHAWIEVPLLLLAMIPLAAFQDAKVRRTSSPVA